MSDYILHLDLTQKQKDKILEEYRESGSRMLEIFLQDEYIPRAVEAYQEGGDK
jgi:hypothetical protein